MLLECVVCGKDFEYEPRPGRRPVACSPECKRRRKTQISEESRTRMSLQECPPEKHGTADGYTRYKCSCAKCTKWMREYKAGRRAVCKHPGCTRYAQAEGLCAAHFTEEFGVTFYQWREDRKQE